MFSALTGYGAAQILYGLATCPEHLIAARALQALAISALWPALFASVGDVGGKGRELGVTLVTMDLGAILGGIVCAALVEELGRRTLFWLGGAFGLVAAALVMILMPEPLQERREVGLRIVLQEFASIPQIWKRDRRFAIASITVALASAGLAVFAAFYPLLGEQVGLADPEIALVQVVVRITTLALRVPSGVLVDRVGGPPLFCIGLLSLSSALALFPVAASALHSVLSVGVGVGMGFVATPTLRAATRGAERGLRAGIWGFSMTLGRGASVYGFGVIGDLWGLATAFWTAAFVSLVGLLTVYVLRPRSSA